MNNNLIGSYIQNQNFNSISGITILTLYYLTELIRTNAITN